MHQMSLIQKTSLIWMNTVKSWFISLPLCIIFSSHKYRSPLTTCNEKEKNNFFRDLSATKNTHAFPWHFNSLVNHLNQDVARLWAFSLTALKHFRREISIEKRKCSIWDKLHSFPISIQNRELMKPCPISWMQHKFQLQTFPNSTTILPYSQKIFQ